MTGLDFIAFAAKLAATRAEAASCRRICTPIGSRPNGRPLMAIRVASPRP
jgi:hypothetical protein